MAVIPKGSVFNGLSGRLGDVVFKVYGNKTVMCKLPDRSHLKDSKAQKANKKRFAAATAYAKAIHHDPVKHKAYSKKVKKGESVYQYAMREYFQKNK